ncbi:MAG: hypothetical protein HQ582_05060, partial [Planctomycetes bacterium]|nr:hypothetical protein [Planctomycetota bacterium]
NLAPVVGNLAADAGVECRVRRDSRTSQAERDQGKLSSCWVVMVRRPDDLGALADDPNWQPLLPEPDAPLWSDDFSNVFAVMKWW